MIGKKCSVSALQQYCAKKNISAPIYEWIDADDGTFICKIKVMDVEHDGHGQSQKDAKHSAASNAIRKLRAHNLYIDEVPKIEQNQASTGDIIKVLRNYCLQNFRSMPIFEIIEETNAENVREFTANCNLGSIRTSAKSKNKKESWQMAAFAMLAMIQEMDALSGALKTTFRDVYKVQNMSLRIIMNLKNDSNQRISNEILDELLNYNTNVQVPIAISEYSTIKLEYYFHAIIMFAETLTQVQYSLSTTLATSKMQGSSLKYLIVYYSNKRWIERQFEMNKIFQYFFDSYIVDVDIITHVSNYSFLYTYHPYNRRFCAHTKPILIEKFKELPKKLSYTYMYPSKTYNFYQCPIKVILYHIPPFMNLTWIKNNTADSINGYDGMILRHLADLMNFTVKMLIERKANMTLGGAICLPKPSELTTSSRPYFMLNYVIVLKNRDKFSSLQQFMKPFKISTWLLFAFMFVLKILIQHLFQSTLNGLNRSFLNLFIALWFGVVFFLRAAYEGFLFEIMHNSPNTPLPQTINAIIKQNYTLLTDVNTAHILDYLPNLERITQIVSTAPNQVFNQFDISDGNVGLLGALPIVTFYMSQRKENITSYALVRENVFTGMHCVYYPRYTFLQPKIDPLLTRLRLHGFIAKYTQIFNFKNAPLRTDKLSRRPTRRLGTALHMDFLDVIFRIIIVLEVAAILIFLLEYLSLHVNILRRIFSRIV
uniref:DRBM domain-containing protein n=1 Tax=Glossina brevipalpis TaxID=37001 RepID=A0A1A9X5L9_9MUSC